MITYKNLEISDKSWIDEIVKKADVMSSDYSFESNFLWSKFLKIDLIDSKEFFSIYSQKLKSYLFPLLKDKDNAYETRLTEIVNLMKKDADSKNIKFRLHGLTLKEKTKLQTIFPNRFNFFSLRNFSDYIYSKEDMQNLKGKINSAKRNFIHRFQELYPNWHNDTLDETKFEPVLKMVEEWLTGKKNKDESLVYENYMLKVAFENFDKLDLMGTVLFVGGQVIGFNMGVMINNYVFDHIIQKGLTEYRGVYDVLSWSICDYLPNECVYINREEDLGFQNLRKAKLQSRPCQILNKYMAVWNG